MKYLFLILLIPALGWGQFNPIFFNSGQANYLRFTQEFENAYWKKNISPVTNGAQVTANSINAPDGALTADTFFNNSGGGNVTLIYDNNIRISSGQTYTFSIYAKAGTSGTFQLSARGATFGTEVYANFDLVNGLVTKIGTLTLAKMQLDNNGWYRCVMTGSATARGIGSIVIGLVRLTTSTRQDFALSTNNCYIWGAKVQTGGTATDYKNEFTQVVYSGASPITP